MKQRITDSAEVSVDFPEKAYYGSFSRHSTFDVKADGHGVHIDLDRSAGEHRHFGLHIHYHLLADILVAVGKTTSRCKELNQVQRGLLTDAARGMLRNLERHAGHGKRHGPTKT